MVYLGRILRSPFFGVQGRIANPQCVAANLYFEKKQNGKIDGFDLQVIYNQLVETCYDLCPTPTWYMMAIRISSF
jgi:hypothetical protein